MRDYLPRSSITRTSRSPTGSASRSISSPSSRATAARSSSRWGRAATSSSAATRTLHGLPRHVPGATGGRSRGCRGRRSGRRPRMARGALGRHRTRRGLRSTSSTGLAAAASTSGAARRVSGVVKRGSSTGAASSRSPRRRRWSASGLLPEAFGEADSFKVVRSFFDRIDQAAPGADVLTRMIYSEFKLRLPELLLMRVDKIGMSVSIEPRVPFLDHMLVEFTMNLPMELKVEGGIAKGLFKEAVRGVLPDDVIDRPKMGFGAPMVEWLRGPFGAAMRAELGRADSSSASREPPRRRGHARPPPRRPRRLRALRLDDLQRGRLVRLLGRQVARGARRLKSGSDTIVYHARLALDREERYSARRSFRARQRSWRRCSKRLFDPVNAGSTPAVARPLLAADREARRARDGSRRAESMIAKARSLGAEQPATSSIARPATSPVCRTRTAASTACSARVSSNTSASPSGVVASSVASCGRVERSSSRSRTRAPSSAGCTPSGSRSRAPS